MFELFGEYSGRDAQTIRDELYDWLQDKNNDVRSVVTKTMLPTPHCSLTGWLMTMRNVKYAGDELTLYALCKLYHRHAIVYTMTGVWTTIKDGVLLNEFDLVEKCDIKLLHLGDYRYGVLTKLEHTKKRLKVKEIDSLQDELIHIRENTDKAHNTRPQKRLNYKDLSEGRSPARPARKQLYKPLPGPGPSEIQMTAQETIEEIRRSRVIGSVTIKTEDEKPKKKVNKTQSVVTQVGSKRTQPDSGGHCPKHCPRAKKRRTYKTTMDPDDMLPEIDSTKITETIPIPMDEDTTDIIKPSSEPEKS